MSSILGIQRQLRELGRIRLGGTAISKGGKPYPVSLDTWRLTSPNPNLIDAAAALWGGTPEPWKDRGYQVITEVDTLPVRVAPQAPRPEYALWSQGGKQRSCDGVTAWVASDGGVMVEHECLCDHDDRECKPSVMLKFFLPDLPDIGVWVYTSTAYTAVRELVPAVEMMAGAPADLGLVIEHREAKQPGQATKQFTVATLRSSVSMRSLLGVGGDQHEALPARGWQEQSSPVPPIPEVVDVPPSPELEVGEELHTSGEGGTVHVLHGVEAITDITEKATEHAWTALLAELESPPSGTMDDHEVALRSLFRRMEQAGVWGDADRTLHAALSQRGFQHVGDMRKAELVQFCTDAWAAAQEAVAAFDD